MIRQAVSRSARRPDLEFVLNLTHDLKCQGGGKAWHGRPVRDENAKLFDAAPKTRKSMVRQRRSGKIERRIIQSKEILDPSPRHEMRRGNTKEELHGSRAGCSSQGKLGGPALLLNRKTAAAPCFLQDPVNVIFHSLLGEV
jgi:hypothetical protein